MGLEIIRRLMTRKGFTSERLSKASGVPKSTIDKIASGATDNPRYKSLKNIVNALGMSVDDFMRLVDDPNLNQIDRKVLEMFHSLNEDGQSRVHVLIRDMMDSGNYRASKSDTGDVVAMPAAAREGGITEVERTPEQIEEIERKRAAFFSEQNKPEL